jgi:pimeloyl-[acyl-carrier protein] methyl ester esterase
MQQLNAILLPGIDGTGKMYGPLMDCLPEWITPQVMSYPTQQALSYAELTEHMLQRLPEKTEFIIIAESFAGPLALMLRERIPGRVKALVLCGTFLSNPRPWLSIPAKVLLRDWMLAMEPNKFLGKVFVTGFEISDAMLDKAISIHKEVSPGVIRHRLYDVFEVDVRALYKQCPVPMLHLYGKHDHLILKYSAREFQRLRPDVHSVSIDGPHYLFQMRPQQCSAKITAFLQQQILLTDN